jgi:integrase
LPKLRLAVTLGADISAASEQTVQRHLDALAEAGHVFLKVGQDAIAQGLGTDDDVYPFYARVHTVKEQMGHSSIKTTAVYLEVVNEGRKERHRKTSPRKNLPL